MPKAKRVPRRMLLEELGKPWSSGVFVMWGPDVKVPDHRVARWLWLCDEAGVVNEGECPDNCSAHNLLPYSTVEFDPYNFPEGTWVLSPCDKHSRIFLDCQNVD